MKHIPIKHPDGDISLDKLRESYLQSTDLNKDFKILDALINKIVEQDSIIQQYDGIDVFVIGFYSNGVLIRVLKNHFDPTKLFRPRTFLLDLENHVRGSSVEKCQIVSIVKFE